jgi:hypothetical protein
MDTHWGAMYCLSLVISDTKSKLPLPRHSDSSRAELSLPLRLAMVKRKRVESALDDDSHAALSLHDGHGDDRWRAPQWQDELDAQAAEAAAALQLDDVEEDVGGRGLLPTVDYEAAEYPDWGLADEQAYERRGGSPVPMQFMQTLARADMSDGDACVRHVPIFKAIHRSWASFLAYRRAYELRTRTRVVVASCVSVAHRNKELLANGDELLLPREFLVWQRVFTCDASDREGHACPFSFKAETTRLRCGQWVVLVQHGRFFHTHESGQQSSAAAPPVNSHKVDQTAKLQYVAAQIADELSQWAPHAAALELQSLSVYLSNLRSQREAALVTPLTPTDAVAPRRSSRRGNASVVTTSLVDEHPTKQRRVSERGDKSRSAVASRERLLRDKSQPLSDDARVDFVNTTRRTRVPVGELPVPQRQSKRLRAEKAELRPSRAKRAGEDVGRQQTQGTRREPSIDTHPNRSSVRESFKSKQTESTGEMMDLPEAAKSRRVSRTSKAVAATTTTTASGGAASKARTKQPTATSRSPASLLSSIKKKLRKLEGNAAITLAEYLAIDKERRSETVEGLERDKVRQPSADNPVTTTRRAEKKKAALVQPPPATVIETESRAVAAPERALSPRRTRRLSVDLKLKEAVSPSKAVEIKTTRRSLRISPPHQNAATKDRTPKPFSTSRDTRIRQSPRKLQLSSDKRIPVKRPADSVDRPLRFQAREVIGNARREAPTELSSHPAMSSDRVKRQRKVPKALELSASPALKKPSKESASSSQPLGPLRAWLSPSPKRPKGEKTDGAVRRLKVVTVKKSKTAMGVTTPMQIVVPRISPKGQATDQILTNDDDDEDWDVVLVANVPTQSKPPLA